jgi:NhaP-type Na+/H+ and K+/H+ antiporter
VIGQNALVSELKLPEGARVVCYYRDGKLAQADSIAKLEEADEVIVITPREEPEETGRTLEAETGRATGETVSDGWRKPLASGRMRHGRIAGVGTRCLS